MSESAYLPCREGTVVDACLVYPAQEVVAVARCALPPDHRRVAAVLYATRCCYALHQGPIQVKVHRRPIVRYSYMSVCIGGYGYTRIVPVAVHKEADRTIV